VHGKKEEIVNHYIDKFSILVFKQAGMKDLIFHSFELFLYFVYDGSLTGF